MDELQRLPPEWVARALTAVMLDLQHPEPVRLEVTWDGDEQMLWLETRHNVAVRDFVRAIVEGAQLIVELADC